MSDNFSSRSMILRTPPSSGRHPPLSPLRIRSSIRRARTPSERSRGQDSSPLHYWNYQRLLDGKHTTKGLEAEIREARRRLQTKTLLKRHQSIPKEPASERRVIFVTHTLPYEVHKREDGTFRLVEPLQRPPQALLTGHEVWTVGMPTIRSPDGKIRYCDYSTELAEFLMNCGQRLIPVFLEQTNNGCLAMVELFHLFHYIAPPMDSGFRTTVEDWKEFKEMNRQFALRVESILMTVGEDLVWIHDYPLMLLPRILRKKFPALHIAFSFRSVFPSSEVYRILPSREELLRGVLSANLITFHNFQYVRHFQTTCTRVLGIECSTAGIEAHPDAGGTGTKLVTIPMGIDPLPYVDCLRSDETQRKIQKLRHSFGNRQVILGVDLLEERKGIPHKLLAFNKFLQNNPEWANKCVFLQIVVPGDDPTADADARMNLLQLIHQMAGEINSKFGSFGLVPVHFLDQRVAPQDLVPVFAIASVALCTSLRDVLSMTAFEYLVCNGCQPQQSASSSETSPGVLILSEFAGTAQSLRAAALCVNPWNTTEYADAISEALSMSKEEMAARAAYGYSYVMKYTQQRWVNDVMEEFDEVVADDSCNTALRPPPRLNHEQVVTSFQHARKRLIVLGFSGTLMPRDRYFNPNVLSSSRLPDVMLANLYSLTMDENTDIVVVSSVSRSLLARALDGVPCWIIAEGGVSFRSAETEEWCGSADHLDTSWMNAVEQVFEYFGDRTPGAFIHKTSCTIAWHFRDNPCGQSGDYGAIQSKELLIHLWAGPLLNAPAETVVGDNSVEVRPVDVSKASQLEYVLEQLPLNAENEGYDMVFCAGDFVVRDEDIFQTVRRVTRKKDFIQDGDDRGWASGECEHFFSGTVGRKNSRAMFHLVDTEDVGFLLAKFAWALSRSAPARD
eukprot:GEMP01010669.1.p1 GENE.GEMP01010669.1~~GEMP01010669.1.p1  ORF type:complete len:916 (+),score=177.88 GEMP01010669.1:43-2748(+)